MKMGLDNILHQTKKFLATSLTALALYAPAQDIAKLNVKSDGSWKKSSDVTLYFQSTTGSQNRDPVKNPYNQSKAEACFIGRNNPDGSLTISYLTTDPDNPSKDAVYASFNSSYVSFLSRQNLEAEVSQRAILMDAKGNISFEKTDLKENLTNPLIWIGQKIYEKADEYDPVKKLGDESGFFSGGTLDIIKNYADSFGRTSHEGLEKVVGKEISINPIPMRSRTSWITTTKKEIGTETTLKFLADKDGKTRISVCYDIGLMREKDTGRAKAYTEAFEITTTAKITQSETCASEKSNPFSGIWTCGEGTKVNEGESYTFIGKTGRLFILAPMEIDNYQKDKKLRTWEIEATGEGIGIIRRAELEDNRQWTKQKQFGKVRLINQDRIEFLLNKDENYSDGITPQYFNRIKDWDKNLAIAPAESTKSIPTKSGGTILDNVPSGNVNLLRKVYGQ